MDSLYTHEVKKHIYQAKSRLPADFPLETREEVYFIWISVQMEHFAWRTVEQRLAIGIELEKLKAAIRREGVGCEIEKVVITD